MLSQQQLIELEPLTQHPKFGRLLKDAIKVWKREDVTPGYGDFGICPDGNRFSWADENKNHDCCLLGAYLYNKEAVEALDYIKQSIKKLINLSDEEISNIWRGFDLIENSKYSKTEAYMFGKTVRNILNIPPYF